MFIGKSDIMFGGDILEQFAPDFNEISLKTVAFCIMNKIMSVILCYLSLVIYRF